MSGYLRSPSRMQKPILRDGPAISSPVSASSRRYCEKSWKCQWEWALWYSKQPTLGVEEIWSSCSSNSPFSFVSSKIVWFASRSAPTGSGYSPTVQSVLPPGPPLAVASVA